MLPKSYLLLKLLSFCQVTGKMGNSIFLLTLPASFNWVSSVYISGFNPPLTDVHQSIYLHNLTAFKQFLCYANHTIIFQRTALLIGLARRVFLFNLWRWAERSKRLTGRPWKHGESITCNTGMLIKLSTCMNHTYVQTCTGYQLFDECLFNLDL